MTRITLADYMKMPHKTRRAFEAWMATNNVPEMSIEVELSSNQITFVKYKQTQSGERERVDGRYVVEKGAVPALSPMPSEVLEMCQ